ncbi:MAG: hypothetical protein JW888_12800 [Pirellulales bacterium]|nr:hypothetical protein [Pirellulales bacterium]
MVIETEQIPFHEWILWASLNWLLVVAALAVTGLFLSSLIAVVRHGPARGLELTFRVVGSSFADLFCMSPRRVWALTWLAIKDSLRRRVVIVFVLFLILLLFAGWFLDPGSDHPLRLYISFVLTSTSYLVLLLMLFLSAFSLPADLKSKTLHTVVTKPVRPSEIVLGRMLGFILLGTFLLVLMGAMSYVFVARGLAHTHEVIPSSLKVVQPGDDAAKGDVPLKGKSTSVNNHRHDVALDRKGRGRLEMTQDHFHRVIRRKQGDKTVYEVGQPEGMRIARVPVYGKLRFMDSQRQEKEAGTNVGDEWSYRSYIEGGSLAAGVWSFEGVTPEQFPERLQVEMTLGVFRTWKGDIEQGIAGVLLLRNPKTGLTVEAKIFPAREFSTDVHQIARKLTPETVYYLKREEDSDGLVKKVKYVREEITGHRKSQYDLFDDLTDDGRLEIWLQCLDPNQYLGVAQADMYLRARDASFALNFMKGYFGIWMQMVLVVGFGVMFSTFLSGSVAMIATVGMLIGGFFRAFMIKLAMGETYGGGPVESFIRLLTQDNVVSDLPAGLRTTVAQTTDAVLQKGLLVVAKLLPPLREFDCAGYVAYGFNISADWIAEQGLTTLSFAVALFVVGYFFLKTREVAK